MSAVPPDAWAAVDLFWYCWTRMPGLSGWTLQRTGYPASGGVLQQDARTLWDQRVIEAAFMGLQGEMSEENERAQQIDKLHQHTRSQGPR